MQTQCPTSMSRSTQQFQLIEKFVFVVTYGRSGSTLIQNLLNSIDGACVRGENSNSLVPVARAWNSVNTSRNLRDMIRIGQPTTSQHPWYGGENITPHRYGLALAELFTQEILAPPVGTRISGFKEIRWANGAESFRIVLDFARTFFPNARLVFNTRDHAEVARSGWWANHPEQEVRKNLERTEQLYDAYLSKYPDSAIRLHYNDYIHDHDALRPLFTFLDEPFDHESVADVMTQKLTHLNSDKPAHT